MPKNRKASHRTSPTSDSKSKSRSALYINKKSNSNSSSTSVLSVDEHGLFRLTSIFVFLWATIAMPLYYDNKYFNILSAKAHTAIVGSAIFATLALISVIQWYVAGKPRIPRRLNSIDVGILILAIASIISCLLSGNIVDSMSGLSGWGVGGIVLLFVSLSYLVMSRHLDLPQNLWLPVIIVNLVIFILGIHHSMGIDLLNMHEQILAKQYYWYIATIGNINWYAGYLCLIIPAFVIFYMECTDKLSKVIYLVFLFLGFINMILAGSDSLYLGLGVCAFFAIPYIFSTSERLLRFAPLPSLYALGLLIVKYHPRFAIKVLSINGISAALLNIWIIAALLLTSIVLILISWYYTFNIKTSRVCIVLFEGFLTITALYFMVDAIMNFGNGWGTSRGRTWIYSIHMFKTFSVKQVLFGVGPEMLGRYYEQLSAYYSKPILVAHCQPLQLLLTIGIVGFAGWAVLWYGVIRSYFRDKIWKRSTIAFFLPLVTYLGQEIVNTQMTTNILLFGVFLSLYSYYKLTTKEVD